MEPCPADKWPSSNSERSLEKLPPSDDAELYCFLDSSSVKSIFFLCTNPSSLASSISIGSSCVLENSSLGATL